MLKPLAMLCMDSPVLGSQLAARLSELGYQIHEVKDPSKLFALTGKHMPFLIITELGQSRQKTLESIRLIRSADSTKHIPILGVDRLTSNQPDPDSLTSGITLVAAEKRILDQLPDLLEQLLAME